jgi:hypothetical protein
MRALDIGRHHAMGTERTGLGLEHVELVTELVRAAELSVGLRFPASIRSRVSEETRPGTPVAAPRDACRSASRASGGFARQEGSHAGVGH